MHLHVAVDDVFQAALVVAKNDGGSIGVGLGCSVLPSPNSLGIPPTNNFLFTVD